VYVSAKSIPTVANGLGVSILSTPKGVMADHQARENNVGGEVLCRVF
jgi:small subunit ribosomal protein S8